MELKKHWLYVFKFLLFFVSSAIGAKIQLFNKANYSNLFAELSPSSGCQNLPSDKIDFIRSVITDTCFIAYNGDNCRAAWSHKYNPGRTSQDDYIYTKSIQLCNEQEGGPQLNFDITKYFPFRDPPITPNILESYHDVCTCVNVPKYVHDRNKWSIGNHHNGLFAYFEANCTELHSKALYIESGHNPNSREMHTHSRRHRGAPLKIQAFGPDPNTTHFQQSCSAYPADKIMKFELLEGLDKASPTGGAVILHGTPSNLTTGANDDLMHFFADPDYQGFHFGSRSTSNCNTFSKPVERHWVNGIGSIQTKTCVMLYLTDDCTGRSVKIEAPGSSNLKSTWESTVTGQHTLALLYAQNTNRKWETKSYHICTKEKGGPQLNVDIVSSDPKVDPINGPVVLESYRNLCTCRNVPEYIQQLWLWSIDNYGNSLMAYFTPDCLSSTLSPLRIPAGQSSYSFGLGFFQKVDESTGIHHRIQSFGPDPNSDYYTKNCNKNWTELTSFGNTKQAVSLDDKLQVMIEGFQALLKKVEELGSVHQDAALNVENIKNYLNEKLKKQRQDIQELTDKVEAHMYD